nr:MULTISPECIES: hypothetical protein [unclassified Bradyrhizobium]
MCVVTGSGLGNIIHHIDVAIAKTPYEFRYQSVHYIVRSRGDQKLDGQNITAGTPCEVQIRTLLQHAHSELTHDTIYKPSVKGTPAIARQSGWEARDNQDGETVSRRGDDCRDDCRAQEFCSL